jgi:hypothetical protein
MIKQIDETLREAVLSPWQKACESSSRPWEATPELRRQWIGMARSGNLTEALAGAFGLCRMSEPSPEESLVSEDFFNKLVSEEIPFDALAIAVLSGGSPPLVFLQSFLSARLWSREDGGHPFYWSIFSSYARHPIAGGALGANVGELGMSPKIKYMLQSNPCTTGLTGGELENSWMVALAIFKGVRVEGVLGRTEVAGVANSLRANLSSKDLRRLLAPLCLEGGLERELENHPVFRKGPCPSLNHRNPSREAIDYFSGEDPVSRVWRFYSPLLILPWLMETYTDQETPLVYLGKLLCGGVPARPYSGRHANFVTRLSENHPLSCP